MFNMGIIFSDFFQPVIGPLPGWIADMEFWLHWTPQVTPRHHPLQTTRPQLSLTDEKGSLPIEQQSRVL